MKKIAILFVLIIALGLCSCNMEENTDVPETTSTPATVPETTPHVCVFGEWTVSVPATCITNGTECRTCKCGVVEEGTIVATGHTETLVEGTPATCTADGKTSSKICSVCHETLLSADVIAATGHKIFRVAGENSTCTASGLTDGEMCETCGCVILVQETVPPLGHGETVTKAAKPSTCISEGYTGDVFCTVCDTVIEKGSVIMTEPHDEVLIPGTPSTYNITGKTPGKQCKNCQTVTVKQENIPLLVHTPTAEEASFLAWVNEVRAEVGLPSVYYDSRAYEVALIRLDEIVDCWSHTRPDGTSYSTAFAEVGYTELYRVGETLGKNATDPELFKDAFYNSPSHIAVIQSKHMTGVGIAITKNAKGYYSIVMSFTKAM